MASRGHKRNLGQERNLRDVRGPFSHRNPFIGKVGSNQQDLNRGEQITGIFPTAINRGIFPASSHMIMPDMGSAGFHWASAISQELRCGIPEVPSKLSCRFCSSELQLQL